MTPFTIASVLRSMFEYADCVDMSVFDASATGLLSLEGMHPSLSVRRVIYLSARVVILITG